MSLQPRITRAELYKSDPLTYRDLESLHRLHLQANDAQKQLLADPRYSGTNVASVYHGAVCTASSVVAGFTASGAAVGDRRGSAWANGSGWNDGTAAAFPDTLTHMFVKPCLIDRFDLVTASDTVVTTKNEITPQTIVTLYGLTSFSLEYMNNAGAWVVIAAPTANTLVWNTYLQATPVLAQGVRCVCNAAADGQYSRITSLEAWLAK